MKPVTAETPLWTRRRVLKTLFCSSTFLALNLHRYALNAAELTAGGNDLHWLAIGDFGSQEPPQTAVANAMATYLSRVKLTPQGLLLIGDNFYGKMSGGLKSDRWRTGFEEIYPASVFPGPCPVVLGNHDYHDNLGGEQTQLSYAQTAGTRWVLPHKWYRLEYPEKKPLVTFLFLDTNLPAISGAIDKTTGQPRPCLTNEEEAEQWRWFEAELAKPRAPWTIVVGHHPVYSNGQHGDSAALVQKLAPLLQQHRVPLYLCGHDHDQQHLELEGLHTSFVLSGCGGARVREMKRNDRGPYTNPIYGFTHLQINSSRLVIRQLDANCNQLHAFAKLPDGRFSLDVS